MHSEFQWTVCIVCLQCLSVFFFCRGYLLSRIELQQHSRCDDPIPATRPNGTDVCWTEAAYDKVVVVVVDGLRFDSVVDEDCGRQGQKPLYVAKFPKLMKLMNSNKVLECNLLMFVTLCIQGRASAVFKFVADPPTGTMQRIEGICTVSDFV